MSFVRSILEAFALVSPREEPRLMVERLEGGEVGLVMLYVPDSGLYFVRPDGLAMHVVSPRKAVRTGGVVSFQVTWRGTASFNGVGQDCYYAAFHLDEPTKVLTELPARRFRVKHLGRNIGYPDSYRVTLR